MEILKLEANQETFLNSFEKNVEEISSIGKRDEREKKSGKWILSPVVKGSLFDPRAKRSTYPTKNTK